MTARSAQSRRGLGLVRRSTATSCRKKAGRLLRPWNDPGRDRERKLADDPGGLLVVKAEGRLAAGRVLRRDRLGASSASTPRSRGVTRLDRVR
jgi:hypothetical protein